MIICAVAFSVCFSASSVCFSYAVGVCVCVCVYHKDVILRVEVWLFEVPAHFGSALFDLKKKA